MQNQPKPPATTYPAIIGIVIAQLREQQNLRQEDVARTLRITQATLSRIETGQSSITVEQLRIIAERLGTNASHILEIAEGIERRMHNEGIVVTAKRDDERLKNALIIIGTAAIIAAFFMVIASESKKG